MALADLSPVPSSFAQSQAKAKPKATPVVSEQSLHQKFSTVMTALKNRGAAVQGNWVLLKDFLRILDLPSQQTTRDYLAGPTSWRLGAGRGKLPALNTDWAYKHGKRGGAEAKAILMSRLVSLRRCCPSTIETDG